MNNNNRANQTEENVNAPVKRGRGRPLKIDAVRTINVNPATGAVYGKGRIKIGTVVLAVTLHRSLVKDYQHGKTAIVSMETITIEKKNKPPIANKINVIVVEAAAPETIAEAAPIQNSEVVHA